MKGRLMMFFEAEGKSMEEIREKFANAKRNRRLDDYFTSEVIKKVDEEDTSTVMGQLKTLFVGSKK